MPHRLATLRVWLTVPLDPAWAGLVISSRLISDLESSREEPGCPTTVPTVLIEALIFDFDGIIVETEEAEYLSWRQIWADAGVELSLEEWAVGIGTIHGDEGFHPYRDLVARSGRNFDPEELRIQHRRLVRDLLETAQLEPGVETWVEDVGRLGLKTAIASSSPRSWVEAHLTRLGVSHWWPVRACFDDCDSAKPDPASYRLACNRLGVGVDDAVAIEDSRNGLLAAKAAGLTCVVVPTVMTAQMDFAEADLVVDSLRDASVGDVLCQLGVPAPSSSAAPQ